LGTTGAKPDHRPLEKEKRMGKIALTLLTSLDGVMQSPGSTDVPFKYRGWTLDFDLGPEGNRFKLEEARNAEALLLGRVTYEAMQAFWPTAEGELADRLNELPKYSSPRRSRTRPGTRPSWATTGRRKWPDCERSSTARSSSMAAAASRGH
jgi:dihydrofolate reductase